MLRVMYSMALSWEDAYRCIGVGRFRILGEVGGQGLEYWGPRGPSRLITSY